MPSQCNARAPATHLLLAQVDGGHVELVGLGVIIDGDDLADPDVVDERGGSEALAEGSNGLVLQGLEEGLGGADLVAGVKIEGEMLALTR